MSLWGILWRSKNRLDGEQRHLIWKDGVPLLFPGRWKAREFICEHYGYIARRKDLRVEPHGWRIPIPVRVDIGFDPRQFRRK